MSVVQPVATTRNVFLCALKFEVVPIITLNSVVTGQNPLDKKPPDIYPNKDPPGKTPKAKDPQRKTLRTNFVNDETFLP